jgi:hypothetical protein
MDSLRLQQEQDDTKAVMATPEGRRFIWKILGDCGTFRVPFVAGAPDVTAFNAGAQNFGLSLLGQIMTVVPESFLTMQKEAMNDEQARKTTDSDTRRGDSDDGRIDD